MIATGTKIGSYRITQPLGAGAMGQVYLARDSRDNRDVQLADALSATHASGIVHRDLKPATITRTEQDELKVLNFGLAKLFRPSESLQTNGWTILGTFHCMSPEQRLGRPADPRSDISPEARFFTRWHRGGNSL
jgi:serine/threonine protein kinase